MTDDIDLPEPLAGTPADSGKRVTIYDVAKVAGVAPSTVSRAYSRPGRVNAETGQRIREIALKLGYHARPVARVDAGEATKLLAFVVADVSNPVYSQIMQGFQIEATTAGYTVMLLDSHEDDLVERRSIESVIDLVDGIVLTSSRMSDSAINQIAKVRPVVAINRVVRTVPSIIPDSTQGMDDVLSLLHEAGHEHVTYLAGPQASWADGMRWRGLVEAAGKLSLKKLRRIGPNPPSPEGGAAAFASWREHPSSAVVAYNDLLAIGFTRAAQASGLVVPDDVSVIGVDNSLVTQIVTPRLTSLAASTQLMGMRAAQVLIRQLQHRSERHAHTLVVPMTLHERESVTTSPTSLKGR
ncbi:MAG: LacI family DNA-binding transcriptional regulator [Actinomycetaceae bacterium]|nr:LacI family DNA-binding transcriptional regulator [Actinomycetaceae bacterium]MDU0969898.1 LacI family DNA-binding transcriptional regulator [Actinomycetaceae bacterium]